MRRYGIRGEPIRCFEFVLKIENRYEHKHCGWRLLEVFGKYLRIILVGLTKVAAYGMYNN